MIGVQPKFRLQYFDRSIIKRNWKSINEGPLKKAGLLVRRIAVNSIRQVKPHGKPGPPGSPPKSRNPARQFKRIYSVPQNLGQSVIVGMVGFGNPNPAPGIQEHGAKVRRSVVPGFSAKQGRNKLGQYTRGVRAGKWRYDRQRKKLVPVRVIQEVEVPKRPFMQPALMRALPRLPLMWSSSLSRY